MFYRKVAQNPVHGWFSRGITKVRRKRWLRSGDASPEPPGRGFRIDTGMSHMESNKFSLNGYAGNYLKAGSESLTNEECWILAVDEDHQVRRRVAENRLCPVEVLIALSSDRHEDVRIAVGEHPDVPDVVLNHLAEDESDDVRYALAENANVCSEILLKLTEDNNPYVCHRARQTLKILNPASVTELNPRTTNSSYLMSM